MGKGACVFSVFSPGVQFLCHYHSKVGAGAKAEASDMLPVWHLRVINQVQGRMPSSRSSSLGVYLIERRSARLVQVLFNARQELSLLYLCKFILIIAH